jgi:hypothetical protein
MPSDKAVAATDSGPGRVPRSADSPAFVAVFVAMFALLLDAVSPAAAELTDLRCSDGVVIILVL